MVKEDKPIAEDADNASALSRLAVAGGAVVVLAVVVLICLIPEENLDFFWQIRTGAEILRTGHPPHFDTYSWDRYGTPWYVPEWMSFVLQTLLYQSGGFFATWLEMVVLTATMALIVYAYLVRRVHPFSALSLTCMMLLAMALDIQERPYLFTYLLLAVTMIITAKARCGNLRLLLWLPPITAVWANLHQGVTVLPVVLLACAGVDAVQALRSRKSADASGIWRRARWMAGACGACVAAAMVSPYGWGIYKNVWITVGNPTAMKYVIEWSPVTRFPFEAFIGFYVLSLVIALGYAATRLPRDSGLLLVTALLFVSAMEHVRGMPLFAVTAVIVAGPHVDSAARRVLGRVTARLKPPPFVPAAVGTLLAIALVGGVAHQCLAEFQSAVGSEGVSPEGIGEAVMQLGWYPTQAVRFMKFEGFPTGLRLYNDYGLGGFLIYELPEDRVFIDGRADIYTGDVLRASIAIRDFAHPAVRADVLRRYPFDCVFTGDLRQAQAFGTTPGWALVYVDDEDRFVLLRDTPEWRPLIVRCQRALRAARAGQG